MDVVENRETIDGIEREVLNPKWQDMPGLQLGSCVQIKLREDNGPRAFAAGRTMRNSSTSLSLRHVAQRVSEQDGVKRIETELLSEEHMVRARFIIEWISGADFVTAWTEIENAGEGSFTVEMLSAFSLDNITPFQRGAAPEQLYLHRFRSNWALEGRHERVLLEDLHMERSWAGYSLVSERFGQVGSMPVRGFFPFAAMEDSGAGVLWGAQLAVPGSWQIECFRSADNVSLSGGLADREFGHWWKTLEPGESFGSPRATLSAVAGDIEDLCDLMLQAQEAQFEPLEEEQNLPIIFNEWCSTWGNPNHTNILSTVEKLAGTPTRYFVIDDGWAERPGDDFQQNGDWNLNTKAFPDGLKATCSAMREQGIIPGIWFEFEVCNPGSQAFDQTSHHLTRDGAILEIGPRRFWDFRDPWVVEFLSEKVIQFLKDNELGYMKVDYNETLGLGCDEWGEQAPGSPGEGLRQHLEAVQTFFRKIRRELPELVIEICSSGGHRLEPSFLGIGAMGSFSDAHETIEIPIIAANLQRLILARQSQVWAVLQPQDSLERVRFSLAATFLGRMCISGNLDELSGEVLDELKHAQEFYVEAAPIILEGRSRLVRKLSKGWRSPKGWQVLVREGRGAAKGRCLIVLHSFASASNRIEIPLPKGKWKLERSFNFVATVEVMDGTLVVEHCPDYYGGSILLKA
ncbi:MAG: alpha-galactosidase [Puniceicoccaceae bacterium]|nr:alpha-galactosidase [Puniceicoccaceae bacterium]